jgi:hypothetical protein
VEQIGLLMGGTHSSNPVEANHVSP